VDSQFGEHIASASGTNCDGAPRVLTMVPSPPPTTIDKAVPAEPVARTTEPKASRNSVARLIPYARIVVALALVAGLRWGQAVWIPLVLSVLISYALEPIVAFMAAHHLPRAAAVPTLLCALLVVGGGAAYALRGEATAFVSRLPVAAHTVAQSIQNLTRGTPTVAKVQAAVRELESAASTAGKKARLDGVTPVRIEEPTFKWSDWLRQGSYGAVEFGGQMFAVLCLVYYLLAAGDLYRRKLVRIVPTLSSKKITVEILTEINRQIERFLIARAAISLIVGVAIWLAFRMVGLDDAGVWGVLSAVLFAVPIVGPVLVVVAATVAAFVQFGSVGMAIGVGGLCVVIGAVEGNVLTPWLMSRVGEMNAVAVFVSLLFWGWMWGAWGLLLAVPITAAAKAICERIPEFSVVSEMLNE
jgi:predicted PurR-regulated permease PerM